MKITIQLMRSPGEVEPGCVTTIEPDVTAQVRLHDVFNGIGIPSERGHYSLCHRDGGVELYLDGKLVYSPEAGP